MTRSKICGCEEPCNTCLKLHCDGCEKMKFMPRSEALCWECREKFPTCPDCGTHYRGDELSCSHCSQKSLGDMLIPDGTQRLMSSASGVQIDLTAEEAEDKFWLMVDQVSKYPIRGYKEFKLAVQERREAMVVLGDRSCKWTGLEGRFVLAGRECYINPRKQKAGYVVGDDKFLAELGRPSDPRLFYDRMAEWLARSSI